MMHRPGRRARRESLRPSPHRGLRVEQLEPRRLMSVGARVWPDTDLTFSHMPDGAPIVAEFPATNSLWSSLTSRFGSESIWQRELARALETWALYSPLNFAQVADDGSPFNAPGAAQHDNRFGDIRIGAYRMDGPGGALAHGYFPSSSGSTSSGDIHLDTSESWSAGTGPDLYTAFLHEVGHALGLPHSSDPSAVMAPVYRGPRTGLAADDIRAIQMLYGARPGDRFAGNVRFESAYDVGPFVDAAGDVTVRGDMTSLSDVDYFRFVAPTDGSVELRLSSTGLSLLDSKLELYDAGRKLLATADATGYGQSESVRFDSLRAGSTYYVVVDESSTSAFPVGAYELSVQLQPGDGQPSGDHGEYEPPPDNGAAADSCSTSLYRLTATRSGSVAIAVPDDSTGIRSVRVYDHRMRPLDVGAEPNADQFDVALRRSRALHVEVGCGASAGSASADSVSEIRFGRNGTVQVTGSSGADRISVGPGLEVAVNDTTFRLNPATVRIVRIIAGDGDDTVTIATAFAVPAIVLGGDGDDELIGGGGDDVLDGGAGDDAIRGGDGNDRIVGGSDDDLLDDGYGDDVIVADIGHDIWLPGPGVNSVVGAPAQGVPSSALRQPRLDRAHNGSRGGREVAAESRTATKRDR